MAERLRVRDFGQCAVFNSSASAIADVIPDINSNVSFTIWFKASRSSNTRTIFSNVISSSNRIGLVLLSTGHLSFGFYNGSSYTFKVSSNAPLDNNTWYFASGTYDGATMKLYVNGIEQLGTSQPILQATVKFSFGSDTAGTAPFRGNLDELALYDSILTLSEQLQARNGNFPESVVLLKCEGNLVDENESVALTGTNVTYTTSNITPTRSTATTRSTAPKRVKVRDMGTALRFDGVDDYVEVPDANIPASTFQNGFTLSAWINPKTLGESSAGYIFDKSTDLNQTGGFVYGLDSNNRIRVRVNAGTGRYAATGVINLNKYQHVAATVASNGTVTHYINGVVSGTPAATGALSGITTTNVLRIGNRSTATDRTWDGIIDEPRIWSRALTAQEISDLYFNNIVPRDSLVAEYLFNEASGTTALDTSGNGKNGTITGATYTLDVPLQLRDSI